MKGWQKYLDMYRPCNDDQANRRWTCGPRRKTPAVASSEMTRHALRIGAREIVGHHDSFLDWRRDACNESAQMGLL